MIYKANCKINVHLRITGKLPDGYHTLETVFQEVPLYDELDIKVIDSESIDFSSSGISIPDNGKNICVNAAELLKKKCNITKGCSIHLTKNVPIGAGLGGGSSDAAVVLKALNELWKCHLSKNGLEKVGLELGADVPFFIKGGCAFAEGKGEVLTHIEPILTEGYILLIYPHIHISTADAYRNLNLNLTKSANNGIFATLLKSGTEMSRIEPELVNDFETLVFGEYPEIEKIKDQLTELGATKALMSGSGSTVFGFFKDSINVKDIETVFNKNYFVKALKV